MSPGCKIIGKNKLDLLRVIKNIKLKFDDLMPFLQLVLILFYESNYSGSSKEIHF
jgi:hypothetical protein